MNKKAILLIMFDHYLSLIIDLFQFVQIKIITVTKSTNKAQPPFHSRGKVGLSIVEYQRTLKQECITINKNLSNDFLENVICYLKIHAKAPI